MEGASQSPGVWTIAVVLFGAVFVSGWQKCAACLTVCPVLLWLQEEVETVVSMLIEQARALARTGMKKHLRVLPMYAGLPSPEQLKVFERVPHTVRKVSSCVCLSSHCPEGCLQHTGCIYQLTSWDCCKCCFEGGFLHLPSVPVSFQTGWEPRTCSLSSLFIFDHS